MAAAESGDGNKGAMMTLISSDNAHFEVDKAAASLSGRVHLMMTEGGGRDAIALPDVDGRTLAKLLEYCNKHAPSAAISSGEPSNAAEAAALEREELEGFDKEFVNVDSDTLASVITAAHYLDIKGVLEIAGQKIADMIKGKTPEQLRRTFAVANHVPTEEEEEFRRQNAWAFE